MICIENAKIYGDLKNEYDSLVSKIEKLNEETQELQKEYLNQLLLRLKRYFNNVKFEITEVIGKGFKASHNGITYNVFIDNCLVLKRGESECYSFSVKPAKRKIKTLEQEIKDNYLKTDIEALRKEVDKLKGDLESLHHQTFTFWFNEKEEALQDVEKVIDSIFK